ncbi:hypothetical protein Tco_0848282 [Tanacetum coccineum]
MLVFLESIACTLYPKILDQILYQDRGKKRRKPSKDVESSRDSRSKEKKSSSTSKDASQSQHKSSGKSAHAEEPSHTVEDSSMQQDQEFVMGYNDEQPADKEVTKANWFKKPERPPTPDPDWSKRQQVNFRPPQTWISQVAHAEEPPTSFDEFNDISFDFSAFVINRLKISNLTQEILVGPAFNLLKGTCKSITELEYHIEECSKATTERLDWHNPENRPYLFDLRMPLSNLTSSKDVYSRRRIIAVTRLTIMKKYDYGHLEEIEVHRDDQKLYTFKEDQFKRKRLMRADELHKFSDGMLNDVRTALHDIVAGIRIQATLSEEIDAKSREVHWWKGIRESSQATGKDNMTLSYFYSTKEDEVIPRVEDVCLVDGVFDGALGGDGDGDFARGDVEAMEEEEEEEYDKDDEENEEDDYYLIKR